MKWPQNVLWSGNSDWWFKLFVFFFLFQQQQQQELFPLGHSCAVCGKVKCKRHRYVEPTADTPLFGWTLKWIDWKLLNTFDSVPLLFSWASSVSFTFNIAGFSLIFTVFFSLTKGFLTALKEQQLTHQQLVSRSSSILGTSGCILVNFSLSHSCTFSISFLVTKPHWGPCCLRSGLRCLWAFSAVFLWTNTSVPPSGYC